MPLLPFVGVDNHSKTFLAYVALICDETTESYQWVLDMAKDVSLQNVPMAIFTDDDLAFGLALPRSWPNVRHNLCLWHLFSAITKHIKKVFDLLTNFCVS